MTIPWSIVARQAAKAAVWLARRAGHSPHELIAEAAQEAAKELEGKGRPAEPPVMRFPRE